MKKLLFVLACGAVAAEGWAGLNAVVSDPLDWLYADSRTADTPALAELDAPANGIADLNVLVDGIEPGHPLEIAFPGSGAGGEVYRLRAVPVTRNTGLNGFLEMNGQVNPYVTRRAPFSVFDVLEPLPSRSVAEPKATEAFLLRLSCSAQGIGEKTLKVVVRQGGKTVERRVTLRVHKTMLPAVGRESFKFTNWFSLPNMAERHGLKMWSEAHWTMFERYLACAVRARQNMLLVPREMIFEKGKDGVVVFTRERFERMLKICDRVGIWYLEGPHLAGFTNGWSSPNFHPQFSTNITTSAAGEAELRHLAGIIAEAIGTYGLRDRWYQHVADEPSSNNAGEYVKTARIVRSCMPGVKVTDAVEQPGFEEVVDAPCPKVDMFERHRAVFAAAHAKPWVYTCCVPGGKWMNRLLDGELLKPVLIPWVCTFEGADGFLHWGGNHYMRGQDPFRETFPAKWNGANGGNSIPPGDTHVIYPGTDGPWPSVRLEATRSGMEDADLLLMLRTKDRAKADELVRRMARGFGDYSTDTRLYRQVRREILEALDARTVTAMSYNIRIGLGDDNLLGTSYPLEWWK